MMGKEKMPPPPPPAWISEGHCFAQLREEKVREKDGEAIVSISAEVGKGRNPNNFPYGKTTEGRRVLVLFGVSPSLAGGEGGGGGGMIVRYK
jgi:hypothetical protein